MALYKVYVVPKHNSKDFELIAEFRSKRLLDQCYKILNREAYLRGNKIHVTIVNFSRRDSKINTYCSE